MQAIPEELPPVQRLNNAAAVDDSKRPPLDPETGRRGRYQPLPDGGQMIVRTGFEELINA